MTPDTTRAERERPLVEQRIHEDVHRALNLIFSEPGLFDIATVTTDFDKLNDAARALNSAAWRASKL